jgi:hypothetical protein
MTDLIRIYSRRRSLALRQVKLAMMPCQAPDPPSPPTRTCGFCSKPKRAYRSRATPNMESPKLFRCTK